jgi:hypothetical protein
MHRSGTSALTGVLNLLGIHAGSDLLPPKDGVNPKGFWEHAEIVSIHELLLESLDSSWKDESSLPDQWWLTPKSVEFRDRIINVLRRDFEGVRYWQVKDPRLCRLLPLWDSVFCALGIQPMFIITLRNPSEVASSLRQRDDLPEAASCLLWLTHLLDAEFYTRKKPRVFVSYEQLLTDWRETLSGVSRSFNLTWPTLTDSIASEIDAFLDPSLRHYPQRDLPNHLSCQLAQQGFALLSNADLNASELDRLRAKTQELVQLVNPWSKRLHRSEKHAARLSHIETENAALRAEIGPVKRTVSWRKFNCEDWSLEPFLLSKEHVNFQSQFFWHFPISDFDFIGLTEYFEESIQMLGRAYPELEGLSTSPENTNPDIEFGQPYKVDVELAEHFKRNNREDYAIYELARQQFERQRHILNP